MSFVQERRVQFSHRTDRREAEDIFVSALWRNGMAGGGFYWQRDING
jgi:hypothetical protein